MEMPRIKTRSKNKDTRPGVNAGLKKKSRHTPVQMAQLDAKKAMKRLAELEDKQRKDDIEYAKTVNHPADRPLSVSASESADTGGTGGGAGDDPTSGDDSDHNAPPDDKSTESSSEDSDTNDSDEGDLPKKKKKKPAAGRADVVASRRTQDPPGTPATALVTADTQKKRKAPEKDTSKKPAKKPKTDPKKKSGLDLKDVKDRRGGPAVDDDMEEHVKRPKSSKKKKGAPKAPLIVIQPIAPRVPSCKELCGGSDKWTLQHLPPGTAAEFTDEVIPLARELAGNLQPWAGLTVKQIQALIDKVYGEDVHTMTAESAWVGLIGYRLTDWRSAFGTRALKGIDNLIESYDSDSDADDEDEFEEESEKESEQEPDVLTTLFPLPCSLPCLFPRRPATGADAPKVLKFTLNAPEGIIAFVEWALQPHLESGTMAFHWKTWGKGLDKKGFLQSHLIVYTFASHLSSLATIPGGYKRLEGFPIGALLLSVQAVHRALEMWKTGEFIIPKKPLNYFGIDNWGDTVVPSPSNKKKGKLVRRATKFLATVEKWDEARWNELKAAADKWIELPARHRAQTGSHSASGSGDDAVLSDDDTVMVLSD
ncbi:hypothetical protein B0H19DRAFT_1277263 [Mycena capillaripes]|nr:hypothetical protein B0H19DRAFT_1277263 [Mycena capillaripes]